MRGITKTPTLICSYFEESNGGSVYDSEFTFFWEQSEPLGIYMYKIESNYSVHQEKWCFIAC